MSLDKLLEIAGAAEELEAYDNNLAVVVDTARVRQLRKLVNTPLKPTDVVDLLTTTGYVKNCSRGHRDIYSNKGSQMAVIPISKIAISKDLKINMETYAVLVRTQGPNQLPVSEQELLEIESAYRWRDRFNSFFWLPTMVTAVGGALVVFADPHLAYFGTALALAGAIGGTYLYGKGTANEAWSDIKNKAHSIGMNAVRELLAGSPGLSDRAPNTA